MNFIQDPSQFLEINKISMYSNNNSNSSNDNDDSHD